MHPPPSAERSDNRNPARRWSHPGSRRFLKPPKGAREQPLPKNTLFDKAGRENCVHEHQIGQRTGCAEAPFATQSASSSNIFHFFAVSPLPDHYPPVTLRLYKSLFPPQPPFSPSPISPTTSSGTPRKKQTSNNEKTNT